MTSAHEVRKLIEAALEARQRAYAPYSRFAVGAALLGEDGRIVTGCNVENAVYPLGLCAERTALVRAVAEGCRHFRAIAIVADSPGVCTPCGACRQTLAEFGEELIVVMANVQGSVETAPLRELLPKAFGQESLVHVDGRYETEAGDEPEVVCKIDQNTPSRDEGGKPR